MTIVVCGYPSLIQKPAFNTCQFGSLKDEMSHDQFVKLWRDLYEKRAIYEKDTNVYEIVPFYRQI